MIVSKIIQHHYVRGAALFAIYAVLLSGCVKVAYELRFDFDVPPLFAAQLGAVLVVIVTAKVVLLRLFQQFGTLLTYFSVPDLLRIVAAMALAGLLPYSCRTVLPDGWLPPRGVVLIDFVVSVSALSALRLGFRVYRERFIRGQLRCHWGTRPILIYGAGDAGATFAHEILRKPQLKLKPIFFIDDDPAKRGRTIHGIPVVGDQGDFSIYRERWKADTCVIAMTEVAGPRLKEIVHRLTLAGIKTEIIPTFGELVTGRAQVTKIRAVEVEDLLGRPKNNFSRTTVAKMIEDKTVMVTGGGGSIGSELCRQVAQLRPTRLLIVERCEVQIFAIEQELIKAGHGAKIVPLVADIRDERRMTEIFEAYQPQVVFHAAAHKHVPLMEQQPYEALCNNSFGTRTMAQLSRLHSVERFVLVSTDKAINPTNVMGATKRLAELFLQAYQQEIDSTTRFMAVRFGNVLGSSGSVIPTFKRQIADGGPVTVTHPDMTRYFMTIPESVGLILQAATLGNGGEIFVLDMGKPVKILDLAKQLIELSGLRPELDIPIVYSGLRPGEKLFEELNHLSENMVATSNAKIMCFVGQPISMSELEDGLRYIEELGNKMTGDQLKMAIKELIPEYSPYLSCK